MALICGPRIEPDHTTLGLLTAALPVSASARLSPGAGLLGDSAAAGQLRQTRCHHDQRLSSTSHCQQCTARGKWVFEGFVLQVGVWTMSSNWNVEDATAIY